MNIARKIGLFLSVASLRLLLFFGMTSLALVFLLGDGEHIKNALVSQDAYGRTKQVIIDTGKQKSQQDNSTIPFDDPEVQKIVSASFDSATLLSASEEVINSAYDWLDGRTPHVDVSVDLTANKEKLATDLSNYAFNRVSALPPCTSIPADTNIFRLSCHPTRVDLNQQRKQVYDVIMNDKNFLPDTTISSADLPKNSDGKAFTDAYKDAPQNFQWFKRLPWILLGLALLACAAILALSKTKRDGTKKIGLSLIGSGVALAVAPILANYILPKLTKPLGNQGTAAISNDVLMQLFRDLNGLLLNIAIQVVALGIIILLFLHFSHPARDRTFHN